MFLVNLLSNIGFLTAGVDSGSQACVVIWLDEPECPKCLIK